MDWTQQEEDESAVNISVQNQQNNDLFVLETLASLKREKIKYNNVAILSPVIGEQFNTGLKRIANILDNNGIPYVSDYNETRDTGYQKRNLKQQGVHLMTIHGSKGLEFPVVILLKMTDTMMASETYD